jgi:hypothetical protein
LPAHFPTLGVDDFQGQARLEAMVGRQGVRRQNFPVSGCKGHLALGRRGEADGEGINANVLSRIEPALQAGDALMADAGATAEIKEKESATDELEIEVLPVHGGAFQRHVIRPTATQQYEGAIGGNGLGNLTAAMDEVESQGPSGATGLAESVECGRIHELFRKQLQRTGIHLSLASIPPGSDEGKE